MKSNNIICKSVLVILIVLFQEVGLANQPESTDHFYSLIQQEKYEEAVSELDKLINAGIKTKEFLLLKGVIYQEQRSYDSAISAYSRFIASYESDGTVYIKRGQCWAEKGAYDKAILDFSKAIELNPNDDWAYFERAMIWENTSVYHMAVQDYSVILKRDANNLSALLGRGVARTENKEFQSAIRDFDKAVEIDPQNAMAYYLRGKSMEANSFCDNAILDYKYAIELKPSYVAAINRLALVLSTCSEKEFRNGEEALALAKQALAIKQGHEQYSTMAAVYAELNNYSKAIEFQKKAIELVKPTQYRIIEGYEKLLFSYQELAPKQ